MRVALVFGLVVAASWAQAYYVRCQGHNHRTFSFVSGWCNDGRFSGNDHRTGNWVNGRCENGGRLDAYDTWTNDWVTGQCDYDPRYPRGPWMSDEEREE